MKIVLALLMLCAAAIAQANEAAALNTPEEQRMLAVAAELRCLVCQNQTIAESNADLAVDLRREISEQIAAGRSDRDILDYMVDRYGDFVLYRPPFKATTVLLWTGPALLLLVGVLVLRRTLRARRAAMHDTPLAQDDRRRAEALLAARDEDTP